MELFPYEKRVWLRTAFITCYACVVRSKNWKSKNPWRKTRHELDKCSAVAELEVLTSEFKYKGWSKKSHNMWLQTASIAYHAYVIRHIMRKTWCWNWNSIGKYMADYIWKKKTTHSPSLIILIIVKRHCWVALLIL